MNHRDLAYWALSALLMPLDVVVAVAIMPWGFAHPNYDRTKMKAWMDGNWWFGKWNRLDAWRNGL